MEKHKRVSFLDFAKGMTLLFMVFQHCSTEFFGSDLHSTLLFRMALILIVLPGVQSFIMSLGYFLMHSQRGTYQLFFRGAKLIIWGFGANIGAGFLYYLSL